MANDLKIKVIPLITKIPDGDEPEEITTQKVEENPLAFSQVRPVTSNEKINSLNSNGATPKTTIKENVEKTLLPKKPTVPKRPKSGPDNYREPIE